MIPESAWYDALSFVRTRACSLLPAAEVDDFVGLVMLEVCASVRTGACGPVRSLRALARKICDERAKNVHRELRRRPWLSAGQLDRIAVVRDGPGPVPLRAEVEMLAAAALFHGSRQRLVISMLAGGGTCEQARLALGLSRGQFNQLVKRMIARARRAAENEENRRRFAIGGDL
ncbi:MAG: hypothetical protein KDC98_13790 [Planctomycetes bacterium]|nr:hypothetical protein [Planctomycetota bacterium]